MKLAEALLERSDLQKRADTLRARVLMNASYQEGEEPAEHAETLLDECVVVLRELERLIAQINLANATALAADGRTLTEILAARETLRAEHSLLTQAADAAGGARVPRQLRSELRQLSALAVPELRAQADAIAVRLREIDGLIQRMNWEVDIPQN